MFPPEVLDYINDHLTTDTTRLLLKKSPFLDVTMKDIAQQIQGRQIAQKKFPFLLDYPQYFYPVKVSLEQASSEITGRFKASLISGFSFVDLTGGMGIDSYLLGQSFEKAVYIEPDTQLCKSAEYNFEILNYKCDIVTQQCEQFLQENTNCFDWLYIDPSRRNEKGKNTSIHHHSPNIVELRDQLLKTANQVMIKLSPMQDIHECVSVLEYINTAYIISYKNEVKELLLVLSQESKSHNPTIIAVDLSKDIIQKFSSKHSDRSEECILSEPKEYLYQPSAAIIKSGNQNHFSNLHKLNKIHPNTQLFTADHRVEGFMGRIFKITSLIASNKKEIARHLPERKVNIIAKNYPLSPAQIKKKFKLKDGGDNYLIAFSDHTNAKKIAICNRLQ